MIGGCVRTFLMVLFLAMTASCTTYSAQEYDPSKHRYPPSRYMHPPTWAYPAYPPDMDNYYIYGTGRGYPVYNHGADNPTLYQQPSPHRQPSYNYPLYYQ